MKVAGTLLAVIIGANLSAQNQSGGLRFDVVSIKSVSSMPTGMGPQAPDLFSLPFATAHQLVSIASGLPAYRVIGGPAWVTSARFQILGKAASPIERGQRRVLVQGLLVDRFHFSGHTEPRELPAYDLVMARSDRKLGPNLKPGLSDCTAFLDGTRPSSEGPTMERDGRTMPRCGFIYSFGNGFLSPLMMGRTMPQLADYLSGQTSRDVIDKTELSGVFDMELTFASEPMTPGMAELTRREAPALLTALPEQLGLKLVSSKATVDVLVIDHIERPTEN